MKPTRLTQSVRLIPANAGGNLAARVIVIGEHAAGATKRPGL